MIYDYRKAFNDTLSKFGYSAKQICDWADIHQSSLSRFRSGKLTLDADQFFRLLESMPREAQEYFWDQMLGKSLSVEQLLSEIDNDQAARILHVIATNLKKPEPRKLQIQLNAS